MGYKLTGMYIRPNGTEQKIRPVIPEWTLFTETDLANNDLGLFTAQTSSWQGLYDRDLAPISNDGQGNYYYETSGRHPVCLRLRSNYPTLMTIPAGKTNREIKCVWDYLSATAYDAQVSMGRYNRDSSYANCMSTNSSSVNRWGDFTANVIYTVESIIDVSANTETGSIFLKSDGSKVGNFGPFTLATAVSGDYYENDCWLGYGTDVSNTHVKLGDVHIYYRDID